MKRILLAALAILLTACLSPSGDAAPQTAEPTPTATALPTATATVSSTPTFTPTPQPTPTPDVSVMSDEERASFVEGYDNYNKIASTVYPNIIILDDGSSYQAYDILTGEVSSLEDVGLAALRLTEVGMTIARGGERGFLEVESSVGGDNLLEILLADGIMPGVDVGDHEDATYVFRKLMQPSNFDNLIWIEGGSRRDISFKGGYIVFASEVQVSGRNAVLVQYVDGNEDFKIHLVYDTTVEQIR